MVKLYNVSEVSQQLSLSVSWVYKMAEKEILPSLKIGKALRFSEENITQFLQKCQTNHTGDGTIPERPSGKYDRSL
jgi:excisionase family DNA binding protein